MNDLRYWMLLMGLLCSGVIYAQQIAADSASAEVQIEWSDEFLYQKEGSDTIMVLSGNVVLRHDSTRMLCDSARLRNGHALSAWGQVQIEHGDSLLIFSDSLEYSGLMRQGHLFGRVVLQRGDQTLFTDRLDYDFQRNLAYYASRALLTNDSTYLRSERGYYYLDEDAIYFKDSVKVVGAQFELHADTLKFLPSARRVEFLGPTLLRVDTVLLYCESGWFDIQSRKGAFTGSPQYVRGAQQGIADSIFYHAAQGQVELVGHARIKEHDRLIRADHIQYEEQTKLSTLKGQVVILEPGRSIRSDTVTFFGQTQTYTTRGHTVVWNEGRRLEALAIEYVDERGLGIAKGEVIWQDTAAGWTILCEEAQYNQHAGFFKASGGTKGRPLFIAVWESDSLFLTADTLMSWQPTDSLSQDSNRFVSAWYDVRVYKSDLQALCDSLSYFSGDSLFSFYGQPILWADTTQFTADTMWMHMTGEAIDWMVLRPNALILNTKDELFFNQIFGRQIKAFFTGEDLARLHVQGNATAIYYMLDEEEAYIGVNKTVCSEMWLNFDRNEVEAIRFLGAPEMEVLPMQQADHQSLKLRGFQWHYHSRPQSVEDLFIPKNTER